MSVFLDLPDELCKEILSEWLRGKELGLLDVSFCSLTLRPQFLIVLALHQGLYCWRLTKVQQLPWMTKRDIRMTGLSLNRFNVSQEWMTALSSHWKHITTLCLFYDIRDWRNNHINNCTSLTELRAYAFDIPCLSSKVLSNLTSLVLVSWPGDKTVLILNAIRKHCRKLRSFHYQCDHTADIANQLLGIVEHNAALESLKLVTDERLLQDLIPMCAHKLLCLSLAGIVDCDTIEYVLQNFHRIDNIEVYTSSENGPGSRVTLKYIKSRHSLNVSGRCNAVEGWKNLLSQLVGLKELHWEDCRKNRTGLVDVLFDSLQIIELKGEIDERILKTMFKKCTSLTSFSLHVNQYINWPKVLTESNVISELTLHGRNDHLVYLLSVCHYLSFVAVFSCYVTKDVIPALMASVTNYRHCATGKTLKCKFELYVGNARHSLEFNGDHFIDTVDVV